MLSAINDVKLTKQIEIEQPNMLAASRKVKIFEKNPGGKKRKADRQLNQEMAAAKEDDPAAHRAAEGFIEVGGKGDMILFGDDVSSRYSPEEVRK